MNDPRPTAAENSGLWFSPQPFPPALLGQRHLDSTLFDLRKLDAARLAPNDRLPKGRSGEQAGSGLIDIKTLVAAQQGEANALTLPVATLTPYRLVAPMAPMPVAAPSNGTTRTALMVTCSALFVAFVALAIAVV